LGGPFDPVFAIPQRVSRRKQGLARGGIGWQQATQLLLCQVCPALVALVDNLGGCLDFRVYVALDRS
jgi:hypothetical protein